MEFFEHIPLPTFQINRQMKILNFSKTAALCFGELSNLAEAIDENSLLKANKLREQSGTWEMTMLDSQKKPALYSVSVRWSENKGYVQCVEMDFKLKELEALVVKQQQRIADTDFQLLEKKEEAEWALIQMKKLSAPLIRLTAKTALVPFFGDLDKALMKHTQGHIADRFYKGEYDDVYIDFTGVETVTDEGIQEFMQLLDLLKLLDANIYLVGIQPKHTAALKDYPQPKVTYTNIIKTKNDLTVQ